METSFAEKTSTASVPTPRRHPPRLSAPDGRSGGRRWSAPSVVALTGSMRGNEIRHNFECSRLDRNTPTRIQGASHPQNSGTASPKSLQACKRRGVDCPGSAPFAAFHHQVKRCRTPVRRSRIGGTSCEHVRLLLRGRYVKYQKISFWRKWNFTPIFPYG